MKLPTGRELRAARTLAGLKQGDLAAEAGVNIATIVRMERSAGTVRSTAKTVEAVLQALERHGVRVTAIGIERIDGGKK
jgi:predicted transcriptional regulator